MSSFAYTFTPSNVEHQEHMAATTSSSGIGPRSLGLGKTAGIVFALCVPVLLILALLVTLSIRRRRAKRAEEDENFSCRGRPADLERVSSSGAMELSIMAPVERPVTGLTWSKRTTSSRDSGLAPSPVSIGPSPVSTIKSSHATTRAFSLVRPTLVEPRRTTSWLSRIVSGEVHDPQAQGTATSSSPACNLKSSHAAPSSLSGLSSSYTTRPSATASSTRAGPPKGLVFQPLSAASPDARPLSSASNGEPMSPSNYIPIYFDRPTTLPPLTTAFPSAAPSAWISSTPVSAPHRNSESTDSSCYTAPSSIPTVHAFATAPSAPTNAPPSSWNPRRFSTASERSASTQFTDCTTTSENESEEEDWAPGLSPVAESPRSPRSPQSARASRRSCTVTRGPPVLARVASRTVVLPVGVGGAAGG